MMKHSYADTAGGGVLSLQGACTIEHANELKEALIEAFGKGKAVAIDLSGLESADLSFFQLLVSAARTASAKGLKFGVTGSLPQFVVDMVKCYGLDAACGPILNVGGDADHA